MTSVNGGWTRISFYVSSIEFHSLKFADVCITGQRVIVVMGATGAQGGSVVRAMKDDKRFHVRAATRNPNSDKAKELVKQGTSTNGFLS
jgi:NmrA-like family